MHLSSHSQTLALITLPLSAQDYACAYKTFSPPNTEGQSLNGQDTVVGQIFNSKTQTFTGFIRKADGKIEVSTNAGDISGWYQITVGSDTAGFLEPTADNRLTGLYRSTSLACQHCRLDST